MSQVGKKTGLQWPRALPALTCNRFLTRHALHQHTASCATGTTTGSVRPFAPPGKASYPTQWWSSLPEATERTKDINHCRGTCHIWWAHSGAMQFRTTDDTWIPTKNISRDAQQQMSHKQNVSDARITSYGTRWWCFHGNCLLKKHSESLSSQTYFYTIYV